jgi:hypothetical protein
MSKVKMISIEGMEHALLGTGIGPTGEEVLVYDARLVETQFSVDDVLENLTEEGFADYAPLFVFLDEDLSGEIAEQTAARTYH